jgi:hypothetical protein
MTQGWSAPARHGFPCGMTFDPATLAADQSLAAQIVDARAPDYEATLTRQFIAQRVVLPATRLCQASRQGRNSATALRGWAREPAVWDPPLANNPAETYLSGDEVAAIHWSPAGTLIWP